MFSVQVLSILLQGRDDMSNMLIKDKVKPNQLRCIPWPYPPRASSVSIHASRENSDRAPVCAPKRFKKAWYRLPGHPIPTTVTFSPNGDTVYIVAAKFDKKAHHLFALDARTGRRRWSTNAVDFGAAASAVEVDLDGNLYVPDSRGLHSFDYDGRQRWSQTWEQLGVKDMGLVPTEEVPIEAPTSLHFTPEPGGYIVTQTVRGVMLLADRKTGEVLSTLDVPAEFGFVNPMPKDIDFMKTPLRYRQLVLRRIRRYFGRISISEVQKILRGFFGGAGAFTDNTIAVSSRSGRSQIFAVGGGPSALTGALVAVDIIEPSKKGGTPDLKAAWWIPLASGSASSTAVSSDGSRLVVGDGGEPGDKKGRILYVDVDECNETYRLRASGQPIERKCKPVWQFKLRGGGISGSIAIDEDGHIYFWDKSGIAGDPDLYHLKDSCKRGKRTPEIVFAKSYAPNKRKGSDHNFQWSSVATVTDNVIFGTLTEVLGVADFTPAPEIFRVLTGARHEVVAVDRLTGKIVWRQPIENDSTAIISVGSDGSIYVPVLALIDLLSFRRLTRIRGGIIKYA